MHTKKRYYKNCLRAFAFTLFSPAAHATPIGTTFTYQGCLGDAGQPANGLYDLQFSLRDAATGGAASGGPVVMEDVHVQNGLFTVTLDFGENAFSEEARWLETGVRPGENTGTFTLLSPRQAVTAAPVALHALHSATAATAGTATTATHAATASSADAVTWNHVTGLPAGFSDGIDNDTTYSAGAGLALNGSQFSVNFAGGGTLNTAARSDHSHFGALWSGSTPNTALALNNSAADGLGGLFRQGSGSGVIPPFEGITAALWADAHDGEALLATSLADGIIGQSTGNAAGAAGVKGESASLSGRGVYGHASATGPFATGSGVVGETDSALGAGVKAIGAGGASAALEIQNGGLRVTGAGVNTPTPAFVHVAASSNILADPTAHGQKTVIDHPLCNGKPGAILIVVPARTDGLVNYDIWSKGFIGVKYDVLSQRWSIHMMGYWGDYAIIDGYIQVNARFNVLVINP